MKCRQDFIPVIIGFFIAYLNVVPMICTLAMLSVLRGVACIFTGGGPVTGLPTTFACLGGKASYRDRKLPERNDPHGCYFHGDRLENDRGTGNRIIK